MKRDEQIYRIFLDPTGNHLIVSTTAGENYYLHSSVRVLKSMKPKVRLL